MLTDHELIDRYREKWPEAITIQRRHHEEN